MEQSSENTSVHANIWQTAPCARYAGTMKISRDFSPLKRLQRLGSTCPDEGMGRTQTFHRPNQGDLELPLAKCANWRAASRELKHHNIGTSSQKHTPMSPVIPLHKRTPCISCLEDSGWHLSTLRNGSPCKQCLQLFAIVAVLLCSNWQGTSAPV